MNDRRLLGLVFLGALVLRLLLLVARGDYIIYDEGYYLLLARSLASGHGFTLNGLPHVALSPFQPLVVAGLSLLGLPDLWASRLLAAVAGAALVFPVAWLARRWGGDQAGVPAALFAATAPGLLAFAPFRTGQWNLYFGSEPLFLLLGMGTLVAALRVVEAPSWRRWALLGALAALSYLTRLEGAVLGVAAGAATLVLLAWQRRWRSLPPAGVAIVTGVLVALPYFVYLHSTLGRWTVSGRVQAAAGQAPQPDAELVRTRRREALQSFVWGGDREALWRALYAIDPSGTRMRSQYWGVAPAPERAAVAAAVARAAAAEAEAQSPEPDLPPLWRQVLRALWIDLSWWLIVLGAAGVWALRRRAVALAWLGAPAVTVLLPAVLAYVEPRAMLIVVPVACVLAGVAVSVLPRPGPRLFRPVVVAGCVALVVPAALDFVRAWPQTTPLQQAAAARRAVGTYLGAHLDSTDRIVSWHPAVAIWARRDWRVLPYDSLAPIVGYARAQSARVLVLSTFEPSPLRDPPRAFTVMLIDSASGSAHGDIRLEQVDATPLVLVGRLRRGAP